MASHSVSIAAALQRITLADAHAQASRSAPAAAPSAAPTIIDSSKWERAMSSAEIDKTDLNAMILDYLLLEGFPDAAVEFARETGLPADVDHAMIQERMEIQEAVEEGRVEEAVRRVNELDPEILDTNAPLLFHLHLLRLIELIRTDQIDLALAFATNELAPRGAQNPEFLADLERTMALLAFPDLAKFSDDSTHHPTLPPATAELLADPAFAPISQLMRRSQRLKVAKELNAAILESQGLGMETKLGGLVRLMSWGEERLEMAGLKVPDSQKAWADKVLAEDLK